MKTIQLICEVVSGYFITRIFHSYIFIKNFCKTLVTKNKINTNDFIGFLKLIFSIYKN